MVYEVTYQLRNGKVIEVDVNAVSDAEAALIALALLPDQATLDSIELPRAA